MATWLVYTDGVSHAARFGQFAMDWRKSVGRSWREQPEGATRSGEGIGKVFHVEHFVLSNLCVPLCMYNRRNPERISRLSGAVSVES